MTHTYVYFTLVDGSILVGKLLGYSPDRKVTLIEDAMGLNFGMGQNGPYHNFYRFNRGIQSEMIELNNDKIISSARPDRDIISSYDAALRYNRDHLDLKFTEGFKGHADQVEKFFYIINQNKQGQPIEADKALTPEQMTNILETYDPSDDKAN